jgi:hypothetical protein
MPPKRVNRRRVKVGRALLVPPERRERSLTLTLGLLHLVSVGPKRSRPTIKVRIFRDRGHPRRTALIAADRRTDACDEVLIEQESPTPASVMILDRDGRAMPARI